VPVKADKPHWWKPDIALSVDFFDSPQALAEGILDSQNQLAGAELLQHR